MFSRQTNGNTRLFHRDYIQGTKFLDVNTMASHSCGGFWGLFSTQTPAGVMESEKEKGRRSRTWTNMANVCRGLRTPPSVRPFSPPQQGESLPSESECAVYIWAFPQSHKIELLDYLMLGRGEQNKFSLSSIGMIDVHLEQLWSCTMSTSAHL